jgi:hypothetical protein
LPNGDITLLCERINLDSSLLPFRFVSALRAVATECDDIRKWAASRSVPVLLSSNDRLTPFWGASRVGS